MKLHSRLLPTIGRGLLVSVLGLGGLQVALAQDSTQADQVDQADATDSTQAQQEQNEELILDASDEEEQSPERFIPTEEISQDLGVSFPVDI